MVFLSRLRSCATTVPSISTRLPRLTLPGYPHHVIQRGNNRQAMFASNADYLMLLQLLGENAVKFGVALHAYVLMSNHFHLLATPDTVEGLPWFSPQVMGRHLVLAHEVCAGGFLGDFRVCRLQPVLQQAGQPPDFR